MLKNELEIPVSSLFYKNLKAKTRYVFNEGGTRSSKTYSLNQVAFVTALQSKEPIIFSIVSETMPHLRKGAMRDFVSFLQRNNLYVEKDHHKSDHIFRFNKSIIEFFSADTLSKVHGPERDYLFVNEIQYLDYEIFFHLCQRTRQRIYADWNPVSEFWVYDEYIRNAQYKDDLTLIHSTLFDNPFLSEHIKKDVLLRAQRDENYKKIYLDGQIGQHEGVVFPNWRIGEFDESLPFGFGLDFGFHPHPDAMVKVAIDVRRKKIYAKECFYKTDQSVEDLRDMVGHYAGPRDLIVADSEAPRLIAELRKKFNVKAVSKPAGSVLEGIRLMLGFELIIDEESVNLIKELRNYLWSDKKAGIPIPAFDHLIDCIRYYVMTQLVKPKGIQKWRG